MGKTCEELRTKLRKIGRKVTGRKHEELAQAHEQERLRQYWQAHNSKLNGRMRGAARDSERTLSSKAQYYGDQANFHWRRHKALVDHDGEWLHVDIPGEVSRPIIQCIDQSWGSDFGSITSKSQELKAQFIAHVEHFVGAFVTKLDKWPMIIIDSNTE